MRAQKFLIAFVAVLLLLFIGFAAYWWVAVDRLRAGIVETRAQLAAFGIDVQHGEPDIGGFPLSLTLRLPSPVVALPDGTRIVGPEALEGRVWLWDLERVQLEGPGRYEVSLTGDELLFEAKEAMMRLEFDGGLPDALSLSLDSFVVTNRRTAQSLAAENVLISLEQILPRAGGQETAFALQIEGVPLPPQAQETSRLMGERIGLIALAGRLEGSLLPGRTPREVAAAWRDSGGIVDLERISLAWGDLGVTGDGTVTLDEAFRPLGAFSLRTQGLPALVTRLAEAGALDPDKAEELQQAFDAAGGSTDERGRRIVTLPLTMQDGELSLGEAVVGPLRPLF